MEVKEERINFKGGMGYRYQILQIILWSLDLFEELLGVFEVVKLESDLIKCLFQKDRFGCWMEKRMWGVRWEINQEFIVVILVGSNGGNMVGNKGSGGRKKQGIFCRNLG